MAKEQVSGMERALLESGTFSLPRSLLQEMNSVGKRLLDLGLVDLDPVKMVGEDRFITTEKGRDTIRPVGVFDSGRAFEEAALLKGQEEGKVKSSGADILAAIQANKAAAEKEKEDAAKGTSPAGGEGEENPSGEV